MKMKIGIYILLITLFVSNTFQLFSQCLPFLSGKVPVYSSSELNPDKVKDYGPYGAVNLFDNDTTTCWATPVQDDNLFYLFFPISNGHSSFQLLNGYAKSLSLYHANSRLKEITCELFMGVLKQGHVSEMHEEYCLYSLRQEFQIHITDTMKWHQIAMPVNWEAALSNAGDVLKSNDITPLSGAFLRFYLKISANNIYKGVTYEDLCISEIQLQEKTDSYQFGNPNNEKIVIIRNTDTTGILKSSAYVYMLLDEDPHNGYCIVQELPSQALGVSVGGEGRYMVVNESAELLDLSAIIGEEVNIYGFIHEKGNIMLDAYTMDEFEKISFNLTIWSVLNPSN